MEHFLQESMQEIDDNNVKSKEKPRNNVEWSALTIIFLPRHFRILNDPRLSGMVDRALIEE